MESGERKRERRSGSLEHYARLVSAASGLGAEIVTYFIAGLPGESFDIAVKNLLYLEALPTVIGISLFYPVPGIEGFDASQIADAPFRRPWEALPGPGAVDIPRPSCLPPSGFPVLPTHSCILKTIHTLRP